MNDSKRVDSFCTKSDDGDHVCALSPVQFSQSDKRSLGMFRSCPTNRYARAHLQTISNIFDEGGKWAIIICATAFLGFFVLTLAGSLRVCAKMCKKSRKNVFSRKKKKVCSVYLFCNSSKILQIVVCICSSIIQMFLLLA